MKILVDGRTYPSKKKALEFFQEAIYGTDGSEKERMEFAYFSILDGCDSINTYSGYAIKR